MRSSTSLGLRPPHLRAWRCASPPRLRGSRTIRSKKGIRGAVIAEVQSIAGAATPGGAQIAACRDQRQGRHPRRKVEIVTYDNKSSSGPTRCAAFQRARERGQGLGRDRELYPSEGRCWRLETLGSSAEDAADHPGTPRPNEITKAIPYNGPMKRTSTPSTGLPDVGRRKPDRHADAAKDLLVDKMHMKTVAIMSEDAALDKAARCSATRLCLPQGGPEGRRACALLLAGYHRLHADLQTTWRARAGRDRHRISHVGVAADSAVEDPAGADPDVRHQRACAGARPSGKGHQWAPPTACRRSRFRRPDVAVTSKTEAGRGGLRGQVRHAAGLYRLHRL